MSSIIRATTTSGLQVAPDNSGSLQLQTNGTTAAVTIDTSQNVGIGLTSLGNKFEVNGAINASTSTTTADAYKFSGWSLIGGSGYDLKFGGYSNGQFRQILFYANDGSGVSSERMRIDSSGNVLVGGSTAFGKLAVQGSSSATTAADLAIARTSSATTIQNAPNITFSDGTTNNTCTIQAGSGNLQFWNYGAGSWNERMRIDTSGNVLVSTNTLYGYQPAPTAKAAAATLTGAELMAGILSTTGTTYTITLPTGTNIDAAVSTSLAANGSFDWYVINTASGTITIAANGNTTLGTLTIATGVSAQFRFRKTAANTYTVYRLG